MYFPRVTQLVLLFAFVGSLIPMPSFASFNFSGDQRSEESRYEQRERYKTLLYQIKSNQHSRYEANKSELVGYPLFPYLEYQSLIHRLSRQTPADIKAFIDQYGDTPLASQLLQNWLYSLAKRGDWKTFINHFDGTTDNTKENTCFHAYALWRNGRTDEALEIAEKLWVVAYSQPDECDAIFKVWRDNNGLTPAIAWRRYESAIMANEITLANYLERFISREDKNTAARLKRFHVQPRRLPTENNYGPDTELGRRILAHGIERLAKRDSESALRTLKKVAGQYQFDPATLTNLYNIIGIRLARNLNTLPLLEELPIDLMRHNNRCAGNTGKAESYSAPAPPLIFNRAETFFSHWLRNVAFMDSSPPMHSNCPIAMKTLLKLSPTSRYMR